MLKTLESSLYVWPFREHWTTKMIFFPYRDQGDFLFPGWIWSVVRPVNEILGKSVQMLLEKMFLTLPKTPMMGNLPLPQISHENSALTVSPDHEGGRVSMLKTAKRRMVSLRTQDKTFERDCWDQPSSSHLLWTWIPSVCAISNRLSFYL